MSGGVSQGTGIEVTPEMVEAGLHELYEHNLGEELPYLLEAVFRAMAYRSPQLLEASQQGNRR